MQLSLLEKAELNFDSKMEETKYLINYYLEGVSIAKEPAGWNQILKSVQKRLDWTSANISLSTLASQVLCLLVNISSLLSVELF